MVTKHFHALRLRENQRYFRTPSGLKILAYPELLPNRDTMGKFRTDNFRAPAKKRLIMAYFKEHL